MPIKLFVRFDKVTLNAGSCQMADSTLAFRTSKEPKLKGLRKNLVMIKYKKIQEWHKT